MYTRQDMDAMRSQRNKRLILAGLLLLATIAVIVVGLVIRNRLLACLGGAAGACVFYFVLDMKAMPYVRYVRFLKDMEEGRRRSHDAAFAALSAGTRFVDGVEVYDLMARTDDTPDVEALFYFDADKPRPNFAVGQRLRLTCYDKFVTGIEVLPNP